jgi:hypothetical protein
MEGFGFRPIGEGEFMDDQKDLGTVAGEDAPKTAIFDVEEFMKRLLHARADKNWQTLVPMIAAADAYAERNKLGRGFSKSTLYKTARGARIPDADELLMLAAIFEPEGGVAYFMPRKPRA